MPPSGKRNTNTILKDAVPPVNSLSLFFFFLMLCKTFVDLTEQHEQKKKKGTTRTFLPFIP